MINDDLNKRMDWLNNSWIQVKKVVEYLGNIVEFLDNRRTGLTRLYLIKSEARE